MKTGREKKAHRRGTALLMTMVYTLLFGALATSMVAYSVGNMQVERADMHLNRALAAAESGMAYLLVQLKTIPRPIISEGSVASMASPTALWSGLNVEGLTGVGGGSNNGMAVSLASAFNACGYFSAGAVATPTGTNPLIVPAIPIDQANDDSTFSITVSWDSANPHTYTDPVSGSVTSYDVLHLKSVGISGGISRTVTMDVQLQKSLTYAVYSNVAIQLGKNVTVFGDIGSRYNGWLYNDPSTGTTVNKGPPVQSFSDWHYLTDSASLDADLNNFRKILVQDNSSGTTALSNRLPASDVAAKAAGYKDLNGDGFIDEYDVALKNMDANKNGNITAQEFTDPTTGAPYDADLMAAIDAPFGAINSSTGLLPDGENVPWSGYGDGTIEGTITQSDGYAKVHGTVKLAMTQSQWNSSVSGWTAWNDTGSGSGGSPTIQDEFEGPIVPTDPNAQPVQFGYNFNNDVNVAPTNFDTTGFESYIPVASGTPATKSNMTATSGTITGGDVTAAMANGTSVTEHSPASVSSGWQATYSRPVFVGVNFTNVRIPKGLNAKFVNCTFNGHTVVELNTNITDPNKSNATTTDPSAGMNWAKVMTNGTTFSADTALTPATSQAAAQGNNLHFSGCNFNGPITASNPTAYTHFADSWEFDGVTNFNNTVDSTVTIMAPNTNIEVGGFTNPGGNPSTLVGAVVAGNIDFRGTANVDGSLVVTGYGAGNTTLGYFGSTDSGQAIPPRNQLPAEANGSYGHLVFRFNKNRGIPNGIKIPVVVNVQSGTYAIQ